MTPQQKKARHLALAAEFASQYLPPAEAEQLARFIPLYYQGVPADELTDRKPRDLYGAALSHWRLAGRPDAQTPRLRLYNPDLEEDGWQSTHTVVEAVCDDQPFLIDSLRMALNHEGLTIHLSIHPVLAMKRDAQGKLLDFDTSRRLDSPCRDQALVHIEVDRRSDAAALDALAQVLEAVLRDVMAAVADWQAMSTKLRGIIATLEKVAKDPPAWLPNLKEELAFLRWLDANHFTFLGYMRYDLGKDDSGDVLWESPTTGLGINRGTGAKRLVGDFMALPPETRAMARRPGLLILTKADRLATVHRPVYMDYIGIRRFNDVGEVIGADRFLGLYASAAYAASVRDIPLVRDKSRYLLDHSGLRPSGHSAKTLSHIIETFPRDQLFQIPADELMDIAQGILHLEEHQRVRLFLSRDPFQRFFSCLLFVPRERYHTDLRRHVQGLFSEAFQADSVEFTVHLSESMLARIHFIIRCRPSCGRNVDLEALEEQVIATLRSWDDELLDAVLEQKGEEQGNHLYQRYRQAFDAAYRDRYPAPMAVHDIELVEALLTGAGDTNGPGRLTMNLYHPAEADPGLLRFKLFHHGGPIPLSAVLPMLEHMGVEVIDEHPFRITVADGTKVALHDFGLRPAATNNLNDQRIKPLFQDCFQRVWDGEVDNDGFNRLVLLAQLNWRQVSVLRSYSKYLKQTGFTFSQRYIEDSLATNPGIARSLVELFEARLGPKAPARSRVRSATRVTGLLTTIQEDLDAVANLDQDRILRRLLAVIQATLRSNWFQTDRTGRPKPYLSFKLDPATIPDLPLPRPRYEIFVCSPRTEGVHLRSGEVARGGLRWSDRKEDYRTEVLGLMKAQVVKNAVIVPVGAKGGFIVKQPPNEGGREALQQEVIACYRTFIRGLLDLTDNRVGERVLPPPDLVRHDGDDPYLVVAADKGTASFSDIANALSADYGFWLGDAFASGGSVGYDHKAMGITARGAWESVKRHFRELGANIQEQAFSVVGIGDMSGDVFGNGMLLSPHIHLVAAFDHRHIFIDPNPDSGPDPAASLRERQRLFALPRSSWADYKQELLSKGGGVWPRTLKTIELSTEAQQVLGTKQSRFTPAQLVHTLLQAPVDLLWNGGIGTYIKATHETNHEVGDRNNDAVRVNGGQLRCRVVGEGGNLGATQAGRIEYALAGGHINTDFIDNAGGVDCSDHEVNIKILLNRVVDAGDLTGKQRNQLLREMTDTVAGLVLRHNYQQTQCLSLVAAEGKRRYDDQIQMIHAMEKEGRLDRALEGMPDDEQLAQREQLCRPEIAVLVCYAKLSLFDSLVTTDLQLDPFFAEELHRYFPPQLQQRFSAEIPHHRLAREIIATVTANDLINRMGGTFVYRLHELTNADPVDITRAYIMAREIFAAERLWGSIEALDNQVPAAIQTRLLLDVSRLLERATRRLLQQRLTSVPIKQRVDQMRPGVEQVAELLPDLLGRDSDHWYPRTVTQLQRDGVPAALTPQIAQLGPLVAAVDIVQIAAATERPITLVCQVYFGLDDCLSLHWLHQRTTALPTGEHWGKLARATLREELNQAQTHITADIIEGNDGETDPDKVIRRWSTRHKVAIEQYHECLAELQASEDTDLAMLSVAARQLHGLMDDAGV